MVICIDVGNTNIKYGIFKGDELAVSFRVATELNRTSDQYGTAIIDMLAVKGIAPSDIHGAIISSVVPSLNYTISHMCAYYLGVEPLMVGAGLKTGHNLRVDDAREVGADRIVNDVAAIKKYGAPLIVVDFGTATTFNVVNEKKEFIGGAVAPGIRSFRVRQSCRAWRSKNPTASSAKTRRPTCSRGWCSASRGWSAISSKKSKRK